ncbi:MAG: HU family DNA-binding protein [Thermosynechococcaceae cyanobacterium MS004]|nr:HU family DNA-binding protein [Thermosynechococcaceae cyanobacterium MS004]
MNKGELIDAIAEKASVMKKDADSILNTTLVSFGTFESRERSQREGRNPKTGEMMTIAATTVPAFSAGKSFKERVAGEK